MDVLYVIISWTLTKAGSSIVLQEIAPPPQAAIADASVGDPSRAGTQVLLYSSYLLDDWLSWSSYEVYGWHI
jgi:hypothetical protein